MTTDEAAKSTRALLAHAQVMLSEATAGIKRLEAQVAQAETALELLAQLLEGQTAEEEPMREAAMICPWARSETTPCVLRDGAVAYTDHGSCAGCDANPLALARERQRQRDATMTGGA